MQIENYDIDRLQTAKENLVRVYEYYYSTSKEARFVRLLGTILKKLDHIIRVAKEEDDD